MNCCMRQFICILTVLLLAAIILLAVSVGLVLLMVNGALPVSAAAIFVAILTFINGIVAAYVFVRLLAARAESGGSCRSLR